MQKIKKRTDKKINQYFFKKRGIEDRETAIKYDDGS